MNLAATHGASEQAKEDKMSVLCRLIPGNVLAVFAMSIMFGGVLHAQPQSQSAPAQSSQSQAAPKDDPEREHALALYRAGKYVEAMPLLEKLSADHPSDAAIKEGWAFSVVAYAATLSDPELRKKARARGRAIALQARELGDTSNLLQMVIAIPEDGSEPAFSDRKEVNDAMKAAEADFVRGDYDKARDGYLHALLLDPKNCEAALFIGDVYFKQHVNGSAGEWFARAIEIDPNRETAYRYWGDALWGMGKNADARQKYIQAVVAEPYNNRSWVGLNQWAQRTKVTLNWVRLQDKSKVTTEEKKTTITIDQSLQKDDPALGAWMVYAASRSRWQREKFQQQFPNEKTYRHTLPEEVEALQAMVAVLNRPENGPKLDPLLGGLVKIDQAGFIEPFALLNRADKDIAQDYGAYRDAHRETIYRYFDEFVVPKAPPQ
jgi:tetratricopeptide (TPR) repeat protein